MIESVVDRAKTNFPLQYAMRDHSEDQEGFRKLEKGETNTWNGHEQVLIEKLWIDLEYQRGVQAKVLEIAKNFQPAAFQCISVYKDKKGRCWVIDGGQRVTAAYLRGFKTVPVMFYVGTKTIAELAALFVETNGNQTQMHNNDDWQAKVTADDLKNCRAIIEEILNKYMLTGGRAADNKVNFTPIKNPELLVIQFVSLGAERFESVIKSYQILCGKHYKKLYATLLNGLFLLEPIALESNVDITRAATLTSLTLKNFNQLNKLRQKNMHDAHPGAYTIACNGPEVESAFAKIVIDRYNAAKKTDEPELRSLS